MLHLQLQILLSLKLFRKVNLWTFNLLILGIKMALEVEKTLIKLEPTFQTNFIFNFQELIIQD